MKAFLIAGTHSGSGKTTVTLGLMAALKKLGCAVVPFKCGPDFIDPSLHTLVTGKISRNLDIWMSGADFTRETFNRHGPAGDIAVIEGVMGMFDGGRSSSAALAGELDIPLILVVDVRSMAESGAAIIKGFESIDPVVKPRAVILNMVGSSRHMQLVSEAVDQHCQAEILGCLPRNLDFTIPSRHLGLHMGEESPVTAENIDKLANAVIENIDIDRLLEITEHETPREPSQDIPEIRQDVRIGVARDKAFCFYYQDNLDILQSCGAEIVFFSPLSDTRLPDNINGLYLGGGYPELYGKELSSNAGMIEDIRRWGGDNRPIYAECGGFMYLTEGITDLEGNFHALVSLFPTRAIMQTKRASLGYRQVTTRGQSFWGPKGTLLRGHEFHYSRIDSMPSGIERIYSVNNDIAEGYRMGNIIGGYMHLHFGFNRQAACHFTQHCKE